MVMAGEKYEPDANTPRADASMLSQKLPWHRVAPAIVGTARSAPYRHMFAYVRGCRCPYLSHSTPPSMVDVKPHVMRDSADRIEYNDEYYGYVLAK